MRKLLKKHWPLVGIAVLIIVIAFYLIQALEGLNNRPDISEIFAGEGVKLKQIHFNQEDPNEKVQWVLDAKEAVFSKDGQQISFTDFHLKLNAEKWPPMELKGGRGDFDRTKGQLNLRQDVQGFAANGYRFATEQMTYHHGSSELKTDEAVTIVGPFFTVKGKGLHCNLADETVVIKTNVTTTVSSEGLPL
jgi:LPS export ABC transporter protein LptC